MNLKGKQYHLNEFGVDNDEIRNELSLKCNATIIIEVNVLIDKDKKDCVIQGSSLDKELIQPTPPSFSLVHCTNLSDLKTSLDTYDENNYILTEYFEIEAVLNWFGEPITDYFRIVNISD